MFWGGDPRIRGGPGLRGGCVRIVCRGSSGGLVLWAVPIGLDRASGGSQGKHRRRLRVRLTVRQGGKRVFGRTIEVSSVGR